MHRSIGVGEEEIVNYEILRAFFWGWLVVSWFKRWLVVPCQAYREWHFSRKDVVLV